MIKRLIGISVIDIGRWS